MMTKSDSFLDKILGAAGATILRRLAAAESVVGGLLVPRTAVGWIRSTDSYSGEIPGIPNSVLNFHKSEAGFEGNISWDQGSTEFKASDLEFVSATIVVALGSDPVSVNCRPHHLASLGKTIDLLIKSKSKTPEKGTHAAAIKPVAPGTDPNPEELKLPSQKKLERPKIPGVRIKKSMTTEKCPACSRSQFTGGDFTGCACIRDLAKSTTVVTIDDDIYIRFGTDWDVNAAEILEETYV